MSFLDDVRTELTEKGQSIADKARDSAEEVRQKNEIKKRESEMEHLIAVIGAKTLQNDLKRTLQECPEEVRQILQLNRQLEELETAMRKTGPTKACIFCGETIPKEARYCTECGRRQVAEEPAPKVAVPAAQAAPIKSLEDEVETAPVTTSCPMCGAIIREGDTKCLVCGYTIQK